MNRRDFSKKTLSAILAYGLLDSLFASNAFLPAIRPIAGKWAIELDAICRDLRLEKIPQTLWQEQVESLFNRVPLEDILQFIDFERLSKGFEFPDLGVNTRYVKFPPLDGLPARTAFAKKIFGLKKDRAIIPHGHSNMCSAHLVIKGSFRQRHYDKVREEQDHLLIRPTIDRTARPGDSSSISDERDNIHWFVAETEAAFTFDVIMTNLNEKAYDIHNLDILEGVTTKDGLIRAPKLDVETALKKYGKMH
ncbi:MAG: hypothetical protein R2792_09815 [Saprospiraceae bacterium]